MKSRLILRDTPVPGSMWLQVPLEGGWDVEYRLVEKGGRIVFDEMHVYPSRLSQTGIDSTLIRSIPVGDHRELILEHVGEMGLLDHRQLEKATTKRGVRRDDVYFARVAARYAELTAAGVSRPVPIIAAELGRKPSSVTAAIRDARRMKLLTAAKKGKAGGRLTREARRLLERSVGEAQEEMFGTTRALVEKVEKDLQEEGGER